MQHKPVMATEVTQLFRDTPPGLIVDATLGSAGHTLALLEDRKDIRILGMDRDAQAIERSKKRISEAGFADRVEFRHASSQNLSREIQCREIQCRGETLMEGRESTGTEAEQVAGRAVGEVIVGVLLDLGVSSEQLDEASRGFSFRTAGPLDMRMDKSQPLTSAKVLNEYTQDKITELLKEYADERYAKRIAAGIVANRPITDCEHLSRVVIEATPRARRQRQGSGTSSRSVSRFGSHSSGAHPARRTFQAVRIEVNQELDILDKTLPQVVDCLAKGGRGVVISYHSGEDRLVKHHFRRAEKGGCECPARLPCNCGAVSQARLLGFLRPTQEEIATNPRASSARLRSFEKQ